jgi:hypothetical protein
MDFSTDQQILCQKWPEVDANELIEFYTEIKLNKKLKIDWINPGRIDPKLLINSTQNIIESKNLEKKENVVIDEKQVKIQDNKFNICDEFLNEDKDDEENNEIFKIENAALISNKIRRDTNTKKLACFDKIFNDMRKSYEINNKLEFEDEFSKEEEEEESNILNSINKDKMIHNNEKKTEDDEMKISSDNIDQNDLFNLDVNLINKENKEESFSDLCNNSDNNNDNYLKEQHEFNIISNDTLIARLKEDEEEFINYRKNNFNNLQSNEDLNITNESDLNNITPEDQSIEKSEDITHNTDISDRNDTHDDENTSNLEDLIQITNTSDSVC